MALLFVLLVYVGDIWIEFKGQQPHLFVMLFTVELNG
jgi:hypothetical protein